MAQPQEYDLSYRTNIGGLFIPPEYITDFAAGEATAIVRRIINPPQAVVNVTLIVKATQGAQAIAISKVLTNVLTIDGEVQPEADQSWLMTFLLSSAETLLLTSKNYFIVQATFSDNTTEVITQGYIQAGREQNIQTTIVDHITILNTPGEVEIGQFQINAQAQDAAGNVLENVPLFYFVSSNAVATVNDTGLVNAESAGTVIVTVGTPQGNLAQRASFTIV